MILYLCDKKACGEACPNEDCHHTAKAAHALHKDADIDGFERVPIDDGLVLVEPTDG